MSIIRQQAIVALLKIPSNGNPSLGEIDAYELGYNSRDEEVKELVIHIQKMFSWNAWDGENREGIREATKLILTKYPL